MGKHTEWRKVAKKARRKRIRQKSAQHRCALEEEEQRCRENSPTYHRWLQDQELMEEHQEKEEERLATEVHRQWLEAEVKARKEWEILQNKLKLIKEERARHQALIKAEWEKEQRRLKELEERKIAEAEEKRQQQILLQQQLNDFIENGGEIPEYLNKILETNPNKTICPFFKKIGSCRFGDACSRNHQRPSISTILLITNFYSHISLEQSFENEHGSSALEFESHERFSHFKEFFYDVVAELEKFGYVRQFKVCCNEEPHLRGNVYVEYKYTNEAMKAYQALQGRWYGGKQLNLEFCGITSWKNAICGLFFKKACPKGSACNFLHVFRNPGGLYHYIERERHTSYNTHDFDSDYTGRNWRWSESPERIPNIYLDNDDHSRHKSRENGRHSKSRSRSKSRSSFKTKKGRRSRSSSRSRRKSHKKSKR